MSDLVIERIGAQGDGVAAGPVYVPFALPGERVKAEVAGERGRFVEVIDASADRVEPQCRHFGACGGCRMQHMRDEAYLAWKRQLVVDALADRGLSPRVEPAIAVGPGQRRRVTLAARRTRKTVLAGYHAEGTHDIVPVEECPVALPALAALMPRLGTLVEPLLSRKGVLDITLTAAANGIDVAISGVRSAAGQDARRAVADTAAELRLARVTADGEVLYLAAEPVVRIGPAVVALPPWAFLQATDRSEAAMRKIVREMASVARRAADLFAGVGTFTFSLAGTAEVLAVESDVALLGALERAARGAPGLRRITTKRRDLHSEPLAGKELEGLDLVVLDPPRAGARAQSDALAASRVPRIVAVSCNPATLARDLRILVDGGYEIERVVPIDQFVWSAHVEAVAVLERR